MLMVQAHISAFDIIGHIRVICYFIVARVSLMLNYMYES